MARSLQPWPAFPYFGMATPQNRTSARHPSLGGNLNTERKKEILPRRSRPDHEHLWPCADVLMVGTSAKVCLVPMAVNHKKKRVNDGGLAMT